MFRVDEERIYAEIGRRRPRAVALSAPDGILPQVQMIAEKIQERYGIDAFIMGDPCYGACDTTDKDATRLGADLSFHIGHATSVMRLGERTVFIDAFDDTPFESVLNKALAMLKGHRRLGLCTISQHLPRLQPAKKFLEKRKFKVVIGVGRGRLLDGQVLGCEFRTAYDIRELVDAFLFLGQSRFHAVGVALSTGKPTYMLDPYLVEVVDMARLTDEWWKKAVLATHKARDAESFGIVVGLREGQILLHRSLELKQKLERLGKKVKLISIREVTEARLAQMGGVDAFIQTACPRLSIDGHDLGRPLLSAPQAEALIEILEGGDPGEFLQRGRWL